MDSSKSYGIVVVVMFLVLSCSSLFIINYSKSVKSNEREEIENYIEHSYVHSRSSADDCACELASRYKGLAISVSNDNDYFTFNCTYEGEHFSVLKAKN